MASQLEKRIDNHDIKLAIHDTYFKLMAAGLSIIGTGVMFLVVKAIGG
jgi:hypothetical protein